VYHNISKRAEVTTLLEVTPTGPVGGQVGSILGSMCLQFSQAFGPRAHLNSSFTGYFGNTDKPRPHLIMIQSYQRVHG